MAGKMTHDLPETLALTHRFVTSLPGRKLRSRRDVFCISAPGVVPNALQQKITADLKATGVDLVTEEKKLAKCSVVVVFATPALVQGLGKTCLQKVLASGSEGHDRPSIHPVIVEGDFNTAVPPELRSFLVRDFTDDSQIYSEHLLATRPLGLVPDVWEVRFGQFQQFESVVKVHLQKEKADAAGMSLVDYIVAHQGKDDREAALARFYTRELLERTRMELNADKAHRVFISYAWEADGRDNLHLQRFLQDLQANLQTAGFEVFLDLADMSGDMQKKMLAGIAQAGTAIVIGTPRLRARCGDAETNVAFEIRAILEKEKAGSMAVMPLLMSGTVATSLPDSLAGFPARVCGSDGDLAGALTAVAPTPGIIPAILQDPRYDVLHAEVAAKGSTGATNAGDYLAQHNARMEHAMKAHNDEQLEVSPEAARETCLETEAQALELDVPGNTLKLMQMKAFLEAALPYALTGFGEGHEVCASSPMQIHYAALIMADPPSLSSLQPYSLTTRSKPINTR